jgi:hypothetical protein
MAKYLDWTTREPTYFISFYESPAATWAEAQRRRSHRNVGGKSNLPDSVRVATVSARALSRAEGFLLLWCRAYHLAAITIQPPHLIVSWERGMVCDGVCSTGDGGQ